LESILKIARPRFAAAERLRSSRRLWQAARRRPATSCWIRNSSKVGRENL